MTDVLVVEVGTAKVVHGCDWEHDIHAELTISNEHGILLP